MFTGIITDIGEVVAVSGGRFTISSRYPVDTIPIGASIAHDGVCLTVTALDAHGTGSHYSVDVSNETLSKTTLGDWRPGRAINLERSLRAGDELGGHIVTGHVDGIARIASIVPDGESRRFTIEPPAALMPLIAAKGSIALDGTSLTVNEVGATTFGINLIPHTLTVTTWGRRTPGDMANVEIDPLARYVARLLETRR